MPNIIPEILTEEPLRFIILLLSMIAIGSLIELWIKNKSLRGYIIAALTWIINIAAFYITVILTDNADASFFNHWSQIIRIQALCIVIGAAIIQIVDRKMKK